MYTYSDGSHWLRGYGLYQEFTQFIGPLLRISPVTYFTQLLNILSLYLSLSPFWVICIISNIPKSFHHFNFDILPRHRISLFQGILSKSLNCWNLKKNPLNLRNIWTRNETHCMVDGWNVVNFQWIESILSYKISIYKRVRNKFLQLRSSSPLNVYKFYITQLPLKC